MIHSVMMTLIFSVVMLMFMAYPAMMIVEWIDTRHPLSDRVQNGLSILLTILLSLGVGIFLEWL